MLGSGVLAKFAVTNLIYDMISRLIPINSLPIVRRLGLLCVLLIGAVLTGRAQTCRVSMGHTPEGRKAYMEVYEYDYVSDKPSFPGGDWKLVEFINSTRRYPKKAYDAGIQGRVTCSFVVNANGSISHIHVIKSVEDSLNEEAVRILAAMPDWEPGRMEGRPVPVRVIRSISFLK